MFGCAICGKRKTIEEYPLDEDHDMRLIITCSECLEQNGINQSRRGLIDQLDLNVEELMGSAVSKAPTTLKRKRSSGTLSTPRRRSKKAKVVLPKEPPATVTCTICFDDKPASEFPAKPPGPKAAKKLTYKDAPLSCAKHLHYTSKTPVCKECIGGALTAAVDLIDPDKLGCPTADCNAVWDQKFVQTYLSFDSFKHYSELLFQQFVAKRTVFWCLDPKCGHGGLVEIPPGYPNLECATCKKRACAICKVEWHQGMSCQEYREEHGHGRDDAEMRVLRKMAKAGAKRCSNCQLAVEKDGGCDYMWCPHCRQQFFWAAAEPVRVGTKSTRKSNGKKKDGNPPAPSFNPLARPCEADAAAARAQAQQAGQQIPLPVFPPPHFFPQAFHAPVLQH